MAGYVRVMTSSELRARMQRLQGLLSNGIDILSNCVETETLYRSQGFNEATTAEAIEARYAEVADLNTQICTELAALNLQDFKYVIKPGRPYNFEKTTITFDDPLYQVDADGPDDVYSVIGISGNLDTVLITDAEDAANNGRWAIASVVNSTMMVGTTLTPNAEDTTLTITLEERYHA